MSKNMHLNEKEMEFIEKLSNVQKYAYIKAYQIDRDGKICRLLERCINLYQNIKSL